MEQFAKADTQVFGISIDSQFCHKEFHEKLKLNFNLLSDANREAIRAYQIVRPEIAGIKEVANRAVFIINRDGYIVYSWMTDNPPELPNFSELLAEAARITG